MAVEEQTEEQGFGVAEPHKYRYRRVFIYSVIVMCFMTVVGKALEQQIFEKDFLQDEGAKRHLRTIAVPAYRGKIVDRRGEPLAVSAPVSSVWLNPRKLVSEPEKIALIAKILQRDPVQLKQWVEQRKKHRHVLLVRRVSPHKIDAKVKALQTLFSVKKTKKNKAVYGSDFLGVETEYRRFYPSGEVFAHVVGFTNVDDKGQEGLELTFDNWLKGDAGKKRILKDGHHRPLDVQSLKAAHDGKELVLSLDRRIQSLADRELELAIRQFQAHSGTAVVLDVKTGEVLAMVNRPVYNPNHKSDFDGRFRNRAMTDQFEPGSTMKPFTVALALDNGLITPDTMIDTTPGTYRVGRKLVRDIKNYGNIDVTTIIKKSSNVGISKIALELPKEEMWQFLSDLGFSHLSQTGFLGEVSGSLPLYTEWSKIGQATLSYGYGLSVTALQLVRSYAVLGARGIKYPVSLLKLEHEPEGERVMKEKTAQQVLSMMEKVVADTGTAPKAAISGYRVAGKTGTVKKSQAGGYTEHKYLAVFAGIAPASDPRLAMVVMIDEPSGEHYYGGSVAAPVFSKVMAGALRLLNITPDDLSIEPNAALAMGTDKR